VTCYHFIVGDQTVSELTEIASLLPPLDMGKGAKLTLRLKAVNYDFHSALFHLNVFCDGLSSCSKQTSSIFFELVGNRESVSVSSGKVSKSKRRNAKKKMQKDSQSSGSCLRLMRVLLFAHITILPIVSHTKESVVAMVGRVADLLRRPVSLAEYFPRPIDVVPGVFKGLTFSAWNPCPANRRLCGDLFYLDADLLEGCSHCVTASENGFYFNNITSNHFDPSARGVSFSTLSDLLSSISPLFRSNFVLHNRALERFDAIETMPLPDAPVPWLGRPVSYEKVNNGASGESILKTYGVRGLMEFPRDWNEEYQVLYSRIMEGEDAVKSLRSLYLLHSEFVKVAIEGAMAVVNEELPPLADVDPCIWKFKNILFSIVTSVDGGLGDDITAHKNASHELTGISFLRNAAVPGLHSFAAVVVDYCGRRVLCRSIVPGILSPNVAVNSPTSLREFGPSADFTSYKCNNEFEKLVAVLAKQLNIKASIFSFPRGEIKVSGPLEMYGITANDQRKYLFDLFRLFPRDPNFPDQAHSHCLLRPELMKPFWEWMISKVLQENMEKKDTEPAHRGVATSDSKFFLDLRFDVNMLVHSNRILFANAEDKAAQEKIFDMVRTFMYSIVIPSFVEVLTRSPSDVHALVPCMRNRGINVRYLGAIAKSCIPGGYGYMLCVEEIVTRSAKSLLRKQLSQGSVGTSAQCTASFLNRYLGARIARPFSTSSFFGECRLWESIQTESCKRFAYTLVTDAALAMVLRKTSLLRGICLAVGITIVAKDFDFTSSIPFCANDVLDIVPRARHFPPGVHYLQEMVDNAVDSFITIPKTQQGTEMLNQALETVYLIMGPLNDLASLGHKWFGNAVDRANTNEFTLDHAKRYALIQERLLGLDDIGTVRAYGNVALCYHDSGKPDTALSFMHRSLYLGMLFGGIHELSVPVTLSNLSIILSCVSDEQIGIAMLQQALSLFEKQLNQPMVAQALHSLALSYETIGEFKAALQYEKQHYKIVSQLYGADNVRSIRSDQFLRSLTELAVRFAKADGKVGKKK
jgi:protein TIF31